jgi:uncharacterized protein (TIGR02217 family)
VSGFHEVRLPLALSFGASGGPERRTEIALLGSGREQRNTPWSASRRRYDLTGAVRTLDDLHTLIAFFEARRGKLYGFRFRDPLDFKSCRPSAAPGPLDQAIAVGDGAMRSFQLTKFYGDAAGAFARAIRKPVAGSVRVAVAGVELTGAAFSVDVQTGLVTFATAPAAGAAVNAGFVFDTPVRFDSDRLDASLDGFGVGRVGQVHLVEVLV